MNKSLFNLLEKFTNEEWSEFKNFIRSPYFVKGRDYTDLFKVLNEYFKKNKTQDNIQDVLYKYQILRKMSQQALSNRLSEMNKLAERFLTLRNLEKKPVNKFSMLFEELIGRELFSNFNITYNNNKEKIKVNDPSELISFSGILQSIGFYYRSKNDIQETYKQFDMHVGCITAYSLDRMLYFATEYYLSDVYGIKYNADIFKKTFQCIDLDSLIKKLETVNNDLYKSVRLRYYVYNSLVNPNKPQLIDKAEDYFDKVHDDLSVDVKIDYFQKMQSNFIIQINKGKASYLYKVFKLFKKRLEDKYTIDFSLAQYPATEFRDFVIVGLRVKEYGWVEDFINEYSYQLNPLIREEEKAMALVRLSTEKKEFITALYILNHQKRSKNHVHNIDSYKYKMMIQYELEYWDELDLTEDSLRHYLLKEGLVEIQKQVAISFIECIKSLIKFKKGICKNGLKEFIYNIENNPKSMIDKKWILEKANEIL